MKLVTGYAGEPHITPENWADLNRGLFGEETYVTEVGRKFEAELISNNLLKIHDGCGVMQGRQVVIPKGQSDEVTIQNGTQGMRRIDLVVERYTKNPDTKIETTETVIIKGTPSKSNPVVPAHIEGDIRSGDTKADWPIYEIELNGITVEEVRPVFKMLMDMSGINKSLSHINDYIVESGKINVSGNIYNYYEKYASGKLVQWGIANYSYTSGYGKIDYPIPFVGGTEDYTLFVQGRYIPSKIVEIMVAAKQSTAYGYAYALLVNNTRPDSHNFDWLAVGRWK